MFASNKQKPTEIAKRRFEDSLNLFDSSTLLRRSEDLISAILHERHTPVNGECTFIGKKPFSKKRCPLKATVATISVTDLIKLISDPDNEIILMKTFLTTTLY
jgi:hypothetical protein